MSHLQCKKAQTGKCETRTGLACSCHKPLIKMSCFMAQRSALPWLPSTWDYEVLCEWQKYKTTASIRICMYVCLCIYTHTCTHTYLYIYISIYLHNYIYAYIYVSVQCLPEFGFVKFAFFPRPALSKTGRQRYVWMLWAWQMYKYRRLLGSVGLGFKFKPSKTFRGDPKQDASEFVESQCFLRPES